MLYWPKKEAYLLGVGKSITAFTEGWIILLQASWLNPKNEEAAKPSFETA